MNTPAYKLFYSPGACSMAVHVALNECNQPFDLVRVQLHGKEKDAELLKVNPRHQVPVLVDGDQVIREGAAILLHILDKHKSPLMPEFGVPRDNALEWLCFCNASLHPAYSLGFYIKAISNEQNVQDAVADFACAKIQRLWDDVEEHLTNNKYLAGDALTMGDILMAVIANWTPKMPRPITIGESTKRVIREVVARPAYQKALAAEQVEYKAAA